MHLWTLQQSTYRLHLLLTADQRGEIGGEIDGCCSLRCSRLPWRRDEHCSLLCRPLHSANSPGVICSFCRHQERNAELRLLLYLIFFHEAGESSPSFIASCNSLSIEGVTVAMVTPTPG